MQVAGRIRAVMLEQFSSVKSVYYLSISLMVFLLGWSISDPFFSVNVNKIVQNTFLVGIFFSLWGVIRIFTDTILGGFFDFFDNKKIILASLLGYVIVGFGYYFINDTANLFILRIFHVFCGSVFWVGIWSYTHHLTPPKKREENIMFETIVSTLPYLFAPLIGAAIFSLSNPRLVYLAVPVGSILAFIILALKGEPTKTKKSATLGSILKKELGVFTKQKGRIAILFYVMIPLFTVSSAFAIFLPVYLISQGYDAYMIAVATVVEILPTIFTMPLGKHSDEKGRTPLFVAGSIATTIGLLLFAYAQNPFQIILSTFIIGAGLAVLSPTANALVGDLAGKNKGVITGITETAKDFGQIIGPILGGIVVGIANFETLVLLLSIIPVVFVLPLVLKKSAH